MQESHAGIVAWTNDTFGPCPSNFRLASRANEELAEAIRAIASDPTSDKAAIEVADTIIVLCRLADKVGLDWGAFEFEPGTVPALFNTTAEYLTYANYWMSQLLSALAGHENFDHTARYLTTLYNVLQWSIRRWDLEPQDVIAAKMVINRGRVWDKPGDGTGYHVRDKSAPDRPGLKAFGLFMGTPVFVGADIPDTTFKIMARQLAAYNG